MTETFAEKKCTPCRGGIPPLTFEEAERSQAQTPKWELREDGHRIERTFRFSNFQEALNFVRPLRKPIRDLMTAKTVTNATRLCYAGIEQLTDFSTVSIF